MMMRPQLCLSILRDDFISFRFPEHCRGASFKKISRRGVDDSSHVKLQSRGNIFRFCCLRVGRQYRVVGYKDDW